MSKQFCTFVLDKLLFGIEVEKVQEVIRYQDMTPVLTAPESIAGLMNLRGQIVTAVDLRRRMGLSKREAVELPMNVVVRTAEGAVSLLVDQIGEVVQTELDTFEALPDSVRGEVRQTTTGVYKLDQGLLHVLNLAATLDGIATEGRDSRTVGKAPEVHRSSSPEESHQKMAAA
jgi:purine-binding chemotaxis protein CheW